MSLGSAQRDNRRISLRPSAVGESLIVREYTGVSTNGPFEKNHDVFVFEI
jgi:hypothetical protein